MRWMFRPILSTKASALWTFCARPVSASSREAVKNSAILGRVKAVSRLFVTLVFVAPSYRSGPPM